MPLTPKNRKEEWLQGLVDHETTLTPKNRPEEWMKQIIDASGGGGGGGGSLLVVVADEAMDTPPEWVGNAIVAWETNVTYNQLHTALTTMLVGVSLPGDETNFKQNIRATAITRLLDYGDNEGVYVVSVEMYYYDNGNIVYNDEYWFAANAENGDLYLCKEVII